MAVVQDYMQHWTAMEARAAATPDDLTLARVQLTVCSLALRAAERRSLLAPAMDRPDLTAQEAVHVLEVLGLRRRLVRP